MALRRIPAPDLFRVTIRQPLQDMPPKGFCYISFRAGMMHREEGKLKADKRKGQVAVVRNDQGAVAVQWYERVFTDGAAAESFTLAEEAELDEVLLEHRAHFEWLNKDRRILKVVTKDSADSTLFFWLQEPEKDKDGELLLRCNKAIHGKAWQPPGQAGSSAAAGAATTGATAPAGAPAPAAQAGANGAPTAANLNLLRQLLQHMQEDSLCFEDVLDPATIETLVSQPGVPERLLDMLPDGQQNARELRETARSVQLWQQMRALSQGIRTGRIDASQFGLSPAQPGVTAFLDAVQQQVDTQRQAQKDAWKAPGAGAAADKPAGGGQGDHPEGDNGAQGMDEG